MQRQMIMSVIMSIIKFDSGYESTVRWTRTPTALHNLKVRGALFKMFKNKWYFLL